MTPGVGSAPTGLGSNTPSGALDEGQDGPPQSPVTTALWWTATFLVLIVLDDLTFGPFFWALSRVAGPWVAFAAALAIYIPAQVILVWRATSERPGRIAAFLLRRFDIRRRSSQVQAREHRLRRRITGVVTSLVMSLLIGGVLPPLTLWRAGYGTTFVRRLSVATATLYAVEFALLHGLLPGSL